MSQQINLFNPLFLKQEKHFSAVTIAQALGIIMLGMLAFYGYNTFEAGSFARQAEDTTRSFRIYQDRLTRVTADFGVGQLDPVEQEIKSIEALLAPRQSLLNNLSGGIQGKTSGYSEYMRAFARQVVNGLWLTGFQIGENEADFSLTGRALYPDLVPTFIRRLGRESIMRGRSLEGLAMGRVAIAVDRPDAAKGQTVNVVDFSLGVISDSGGPPAAGQAPAPAPAAEAKQ